MRWTQARSKEGRINPRGQAVAPLLVTLAITAAGTGLIIPVINSRQQDMAKARSMRNLQTLARATRMYTMDWNGTFPGWQKNPNGSYSHNVWDQQIFPYVGKNDAYTNGRPGGIRSYADPQKQRILSYGLNGLLICPPRYFTGSIRSTMVINESGGKDRPVPRQLEDITRPHDTILLAELATESPVRDAFTVWNLPYVPTQTQDGSPAWNAALDHWIDISPREWVENNSTPEGVAFPYEPGNWNPDNGIARNLYGGGGNYAFVDGHVEFLPIGETVGLGKTVWDPVSSPSRIMPGSTVWRGYNYLNMWNPDRLLPAARERGPGPRWPIAR